eukprot:4731901-Pleurochrysis_carterae.AAC.1
MSERPSTVACTTSATSRTSSISSAGGAPSSSRHAPTKSAATRSRCGKRCATGAPSGGWPFSCAAGAPMSTASSWNNLTPSRRTSFLSHDQRASASPTSATPPASPSTCSFARRTSPTSRAHTRSPVRLDSGSWPTSPTPTADFPDSDSRDRHRSSWARLPRLCAALAWQLAPCDPVAATPDFETLIQSFALQWHLAGLPVPHDYASPTGQPTCAATRAYQLQRGPGDERA